MDILVEGLTFQENEWSVRLKGQHVANERWTRKILWCRSKCRPRGLKKLFQRFVLEAQHYKDIVSKRYNFKKQNIKEKYKRGAYTIYYIIYNSFSYLRYIHLRKLISNVDYTVYFNIYPAYMYSITICMPPAFADSPLTPWQQLAGKTPFHHN